MAGRRGMIGKILQKVGRALSGGSGGGSGGGRKRSKSRSSSGKGGFLRKLLR